MPFATYQDNNQDIKINYEVVGSGEPIVFHHGNGNSIKDWHTLGYVEPLAKDFQLILLDSRGYGQSSKLYDPADYSLASRAADTIAVLDAVGVKKAHCLGGSIGASLCFILAKYYPKRFKSYIFATPYFTLFDDSLKPSLLAGPQAFIEKLEELIGARFANEAVRKSILANDTKAMWAANSSEWFDYLDYVQYIKAPSLIYVGSEEPSLASLKELDKKLPQNKLHIFPGLDHAEVYWQGKLVAPVIRDFVNSV